MEETNFRARMKTYESTENQGTVTDSEATAEADAPIEQLVTLTPLYILFGLTFAISWIVIWKQRILTRPRASSPPSLNSRLPTDEPPVSAEH